MVIRRSAQPGTQCLVGQRRQALLHLQGGAGSRDGLLGVFAGWKAVAVLAVEQAGDEIEFLPEGNIGQ